MTHDAVITLPEPQDSSLLGSRLDDGGCRFGLWAPRATRVELALVNEDRSQVNVDMQQRPDGVWVTHVPGVTARQMYGFRVHGEWNPNKGQRFNPAKLLLDPYAQAITAGVDYSGPIMDHTPQSNYQPDTHDSSAAVPLSVVVNGTPPPTPLAARRPLTESVILETHVKGFTRLHPAVPEHLRGTYLGLAYPAVIDYLLDVGINTVQLLPVHHFVSEPFVVGKGLTNYWGYNTLGFFAPHSAYSSSGSHGGQVAEFKQMVSALHEAGIQVFLDVVYNHTGEGGHEGPTLAFRGIDHSGYYRLTQDLHNDYDVTGCGNSIDTSQPGVRTLVLDSMRYWVTEMGVDGFRFDLATTLIRDEHHHVTQDHPFKQAIVDDPAFDGIHMVAEPWDLGPYGYQVGAWGPDWSEWNDRFRGFTRDFWRGASHGVQELAARLSGSGDIFDHSGRGMASSVNFVTAHDGFTMRDLVTYDIKHNEANLEHNRDGSDDNRSWNCGWEGETDHADIYELRHRQVRNMMATLLLAFGVPMITAGDEAGRTQSGNNNAYCQDTPLSWVQWDAQERWDDITDLTRTLLALRAEHPCLRPQTFRHHTEIVSAAGEPLGRKDLAWLDGFEGEMGDDDWHDGARRVLGMYVSDVDEAFVAWFNGSAQDVTITLPARTWGTSYQPLVTTAEDDEVGDDPLMPGDEFVVPARSVTIMQAEVSSVPLPPESEPGMATVAASDEDGPDGTLEAGTGASGVTDTEQQPVLSASR